MTKENLTKEQGGTEQQEMREKKQQPKNPTELNNITAANKSTINSYISYIVNLQMEKRRERERETEKKEEKRRQNEKNREKMVSN